jgi:hypothetical protein
MTGTLYRGLSGRLLFIPACPGLRPGLKERGPLGRSARPEGPLSLSPAQRAGDNKYCHHPRPSGARYNLGR